MFFTFLVSSSSFIFISSSCSSFFPLSYVLCFHVYLLYTFLLSQILCFISFTEIFNSFQSTSLKPFQVLHILINIIFKSKFRTFVVYHTTFAYTNLKTLLRSQIMQVTFYYHCQDYFWSCLLLLSLYTILSVVSKLTSFTSKLIMII